jgi:hypothetical protein
MQHICSDPFLLAGRSRNAQRVRGMLARRR